MDLLAVALPALSEAWGLILQPTVLVYLFLGVTMGLAIGVFPGLGGIAGLSLVLPFMFGLEPVYGLALMIGMVAVVPTSDTFASVLMGIPGSSASQATVLDGFPMAKKGMAARALSAAFASSLFGGLIGAFFLTFFILVARPVAHGIGIWIVDGWHSSWTGGAKGVDGGRRWYAGRIHWRRAVQWRITHGKL